MERRSSPRRREALVPDVLVTAFTIGGAGAAPGEDIPAPTYPTSVPIYGVRGEIDASAARALANRQFGTGGGTQVFIDEANELIRLAASPAG